MKHVVAALASALFFCAGVAASFAAAAPAQPIAATVRFEPRSVPKAKTRTAVVIVLGSSDATPGVTAANCVCVLEVVKEVNPARLPAERHQMHASRRGAREVAADMTFPAAGTYVLDLTCSPKYPNTFDAFQKTFRTKVSA